MNLNKKILIGSTANGRIESWQRGKAPMSYLPFHSVDSVKEAEDLIVLHCKMSADPYNKGYFIPGITGEADQLFELSERFSK